MLYALGDPISFLLLAASFVVAVTAQGWVSGLAAARTGSRQLRRAGQLRPDPRRHLDPFGVVAALLAGVGWPRPLPPRAGRSRPAALLVECLAGPGFNLAVAVAALLTFRGLSGQSLAAVSSSVLAHGITGGTAAERAVLLFGLMNAYVGLLSLVPLPPLNGGRLLFGLAPRSAGWRRAEYQLVEQNFGLVALLVLLLLPLGGGRPLLLVLLDDVASPLARLVTGA